jgi:hypothetical protein
MRKTIARILAPLFLASAFIGIGATAASANPPSRQTCYRTYDDGVFRKSHYVLDYQTYHVCSYFKWTQGVYQGHAVIDKPGVLR